MEYFTCEHCLGTGMEFPECQTCGGTGWEDDPDDGGTMTCTECFGEPCSVCGGSGEKPVRDM